jgi:hypothetical protein
MSIVYLPLAIQVNSVILFWGGGGIFYSGIVEFSPLEFGKSNFIDEQSFMKWIH